MGRVLLFSAITVGLLPSAVAGQSSASSASINVGNHVLAPNLSGQTVQILVTNNGPGGQFPISGADVNVEVSDGGPSNGGTLGPQLTAADLITGTIFAANNNGEQNITSQPQIYEGAITTSGGTVNANGLLATLTLNTTNIAPGIYSLKLANFKNAAVNGDTDLGVDQNFNTISPVITNGNVVVSYPGDTNLDGSVGFDDLVTLARNYGRSNATWSMGDFNNDGTVAFDDFVTLARNYGNNVNINPPPPSIVAALAASVVPEPLSLGVVAFVVAGLWRRKS